MALCGPISVTQQMGYQTTIYNSIQSISKVIYYKYLYMKMLSVAVSKLNLETDTDHVAYEGANLCKFDKKIDNYKTKCNFLKNEIKIK